MREAGRGLPQGGRTWQPFVGRKNGNDNFRQARIYNFCIKCVVFAQICKINSVKYAIYPCNSALLAQETLFFDPKRHFCCPKISKKCVNRDKLAHVWASNFCPNPNFSAGAARAPMQLLPPWATEKVKMSFFVY